MAFLNVLHISPQPKAVVERRLRQGIDVSALLQERFRNWMQSLQMETVFAEDGIPSVDRLKESDGVVISGSVLSVYQNDIPWIAELEELVRRAVAEQVPMLGICFGHQLIAQAMGGKVAPGESGKEAGVIRIHRTTASDFDPLFDQVGFEFNASSVHSDAVVELPKVAGMPVRALARSRKYLQSFAIGDVVRTVQFHPEFDQKTLDSLLESEFKPHEVEMDPSADREEVVAKGRQMLRNFIMYFVHRRRTAPSGRNRGTI